MPLYKNLYNKPPTLDTEPEILAGKVIEAEGGRNIDVRVKILTSYALTHLGGEGLGLQLTFEVISGLDNIISIFAGEFCETSENEEFAIIARYFGKALGQYQNIFIGYGQDLIDLEKSKLHQYKDKSIHDIEADSKIRIYVPENSGSKKTYVSIISGINNLSIPEDRIIRTQGDNYGSHRFLCWWVIADSVLKLEANFIDLVSVATKKIKRLVADGVAKQSEDLKFYNRGAILDISEKSLDTNTYSPIEFMKMTDLTDYLESYISGFVHKTSFLGLTTNISEKTERLTKGEHYKDLKMIANRTQNTLNELAVLSKRMKKEFSIDLTFDQTSKPNEEGELDKDGTEGQQKNKNDGI